MISLIIAESALERVPKEIRSHSSVKSHAIRTGKDPRNLLLDRSYHHAAMKGFTSGEKRGRPDLVHFALLSALSTPLYLEDELRVYLHTADNHVIIVGRKVRLPKTYARFESLIVQLLQSEIIESNGQMLLSTREMNFQELSRTMDSDLTIGLSSNGTRKSPRLIAEELLLAHNATVVVGGFPAGDFSRSISDNMDSLYSISSRRLEAHVVVARLIYELELARNR